MATPADKDSLDNIGKINAAAKTLADTYKQIEQSTGRLNTEQKETLDIAKSLASASSDIEKSIKNTELFNALQRLLRLLKISNSNLKCKFITFSKILTDEPKSILLSYNLINQILHIIFIQFYSQSFNR